MQTARKTIHLEYEENTSNGTATVYLPPIFDGWLQIDTFHFDGISHNDKNITFIEQYGKTFTGDSIDTRIVRFYPIASIEEVTTRKPQ